MSSITNNQNPVAAPQTTVDLPVKTGDDFLGEFEVMDLSALRGQTFLVGVSTGDRNKGKYLSSTARGPYSFEEMCEEVGVMWKEQQHHAKVVLLTKKRDEPIKTLDENTTDYIEAHFADIIVESMLEGVFDDKEYTCKAGIVDADLSEEPAKVSTAKKEEDDEDDL